MSELGNGLLGAVCAGGIIVGVVALDGVADGVDAGVESAWGKVWRWCEDRVGRGEGEEMQEGEEMVIDEEGTRREVEVHEMEEVTSTVRPRGSELSPSQRKERPALPASAFPALPLPPSPSGQEVAYTSGSSCLYESGQHASGLLGPSPMPPRRTSVGWQHFTGNGFHRHEQKLRAVEQWSNMGRRGRTFDEVLREVEEKDEQE